MANPRQLDDCSQQVSAAASASSAGRLSVGEGVRDAAPVPCLVPGFADACKLVTAPYSCLVTETHRRHVVLPPMHLKKKKTGIQEELNAELLKYSTSCRCPYNELELNPVQMVSLESWVSLLSLQGVPLAYDGIKVLGQHGDIIGDQGYIHLNIEATFVIFKPKRGEKLVGVINKIGVGHVGCLVHGCFNACVLKPTKLTPDQWRTSGLQLGGSLAFEVSQLDADVAGVLLIKGRLEKSRVQELVTMFSSTEAEEQLELASAEAGEGAEEDGGLPQPKKKKKKKDKQPDAATPEDVGSSQAADWMSLEVDGNGMETHSDPDGQPKKKKKKKKKDKRQESPEEESPPEEVAPPAELPASDSSGYVSDKHSRKRKTQDNSNVPVTKKKKK